MVYVSVKMRRLSRALKLGQLVETSKRYFITRHLPDVIEREVTSAESSPTAAYSFPCSCLSQPASLPPSLLNIVSRSSNHRILVVSSTTSLIYSEEQETARSIEGTDCLSCREHGDSDDFKAVHTMNAGSGSGGGGGAGNGGGESNATAGPDLEQINTEQLTFQSVAGEDKLRLLPSPWPADSLPSPTSSLLSVASTKGLLAAAGPDTLVIASTDSIRQSYTNDAAEAESKVKTFTPQATIPIPRVSQLTFSSDGTCLVISAEQSGGLAVYDTSALLSGGKEAAFQVATEGQSVRQLLPNPNPAPDTFGLFVVVTENGQLLLADLKERKLVNGANGGLVLQEQVSCACWSRLGRQVVAGLADGTAVQIDGKGIVKASIPEPPQLSGLKDPGASAYPITSIFWLETHDFLIIHTPVSGANDDSIYHLAHRDKATSTWAFSKFEDPCPPFGLERRPAHHFVQRLRDWLSLSDSLVLASTRSTDIGLFTKSQTALDLENPVVDAFTYTQPPDSRRAAMPMGAAEDTSPIGMALDLSTKEKVPKPIPNEETLDESPVPLPALYVLDQEGMLSMWWIVYNESVKKDEPFADLIAAGGPRPLGEQKQQSDASTSRPATSGSAPFGMVTSTAPAQAQPASTFGQPSQPSSTPSHPAFGAPSTPAFGTSSLGMRQSPWGATSPPSNATGGGQFGKPSTFGTGSSFGQSNFGQAGGMGANKASIWGTPQQATQQQSSPGAGGGIFGGNTAQQSPFMNVGNKGNTSGFANLGGAGSGKENQPQPSPFANKPSLPAEPSGSTVSLANGSSFGSGSTNFGVASFGSHSPFSGGGTFGKPSATDSREESMNDDGTSETSTLKAPGSENENENKNQLGLGAGGFQLGSTFKGDGTAKDDLPKPKNPGAGLFGNDFGASLDAGSGDAGNKGSALSGAENAAWWSGRTTPASNQGIKEEPDSEEEPKLKDIPPAEPRQESKEAAKPPPSDDAPLPPDPTTWKPKEGALPPPIPPGFGADFSVPKSSQTRAPEEKAEDAPLPPDSTYQSKKEGEGPLAGSPPVDLGTEKFSEGVRSEDGEDEEAAGPPESEDEEGEWSDEEEEEGEEGGEDDEEGDEHGTPEITDPKGLSAFEARLTPASPKRPQQQPQDESTTPASPERPDQQQKNESTTPATDKKDSYTPAGMPKAPIMFAPPQRKGQDSPRSPSPVRSATSPVRHMPSFGSQQPASKGLALPPQPQQQQKPSQSSLFGSSQTPSAPQMASSQLRQSSQAQQTQPQRIAVPPAQLVQNKKPPGLSKPTEAQEGDLEDEEDARIQAILAAPVEPTKDVPAFLAHQDYVARAEEKAGLGGQIERVYRDINSMIDTLALNARSLKGSVEGNLQARGEAQKDRLDLEEEEGWLLGETGELDGILEGIDIELEDGRLEDVKSALEVLRDEGKEMNRLRSKGVELRKQIAARSDPEQLAQEQAAPLPLESQTQQSELRHGVQQVQKLLARAEEQLSVLRAELASLLGQTQDGKNGKGVPTVEAVMNTILKMTAMVEKKSGDIDVLESQIRKLRGASSLQPNYEDDLAASMRASRLSNSSPLAMKASMRISAYGSPVASRRSPARSGTPGGKRGLFDVPDAEVEAYRLKKQGRRQAMDRLREQLEVRGPRVVKVGE